MGRGTGAMQMKSGFGAIPAAARAQDGRGAEVKRGETDAGGDGEEVDGGVEGDQRVHFRTRV